MNFKITDYLEDIVTRLPNKVAYIDQEREISFSEIRGEAFSIAEELIARGYYKQPVLLLWRRASH